MKPALINVRTLCKLLKIGSTKAYGLMNDRTIESLKIGRSRKVVLESVEKYVGHKIDIDIKNFEDIASENREPAKGDLSDSALYSNCMGLKCQFKGDSGFPGPVNDQKRTIFFSINGWMSGEE